MLIVFAIVCFFFLGAGLSLRFKVLVLVPVLLVALPLNYFVMVSEGHGFGSAVLSSIGGLLTLNLGYLSGALASFYRFKEPREAFRDESRMFPNQAIVEPTRFFASGKQLGDVGRDRSGGSGAAWSNVSRSWRRRALRAQSSPKSHGGDGPSPRA
jgi:hypothetical protein